MVNILFLERKPVFRTSGSGSSSASQTILERLSFIMKEEIQHSSPVTTSENFLLEPFGSNSCNHLRQIHYIVTICSFCSVFNWRGTYLSNLLDRLSCSWTIACKYRVFQKFVPIFYSLKFH